MHSYAQHRVQAERVEAQEPRALCYRFSEFELDLCRVELRRDGAVVAIAPKSLGVLAHLLRHRDRLVSRSELLDHLWPDVVVGKGSLSQAIWEVRRALGDHRGAPRFIRTKYNHGYHFTGAVETQRGLPIDELLVREHGLVDVGLFFVQRG